MALVESQLFEIGKQAPDFTLLDTVSNSPVSLEDVKGKVGTAIFFICNHCPFVIHINEGLVNMAYDYVQKGIGFVAISSNNVITHPQDGPEHMAVHARKNNYPFPYLYDEDQDVARAYNASCTPDLYLFDSDLQLTYHGQLDDSRPSNDVPVSGVDFRKAIDALLSNETALKVQKPSIGCSIKWK